VLRQIYTTDVGRKHYVTFSLLPRTSLSNFYRRLHYVISLGFCQHCQTCPLLPFYFRWKDNYLHYNVFCHCFINSTSYCILKYLRSLFSKTWNLVLFSFSFQMPLVLKPGLWSRYTKAPTPTPAPTPRYLNLRVRLRLIHKNSICTNNGKPVRHFITTT
jgi:hypothetical protein